MKWERFFVRYDNIWQTIIYKNYSTSWSNYYMWWPRCMNFTRKYSKNQRLLGNRSVPNEVTFGGREPKRPKAECNFGNLGFPRRWLGISTIHSILLPGGYSNITPPHYFARILTSSWDKKWYLPENTEDWDTVAFVLGMPLQTENIIHSIFNVCFHSKWHGRYNGIKLWSDYGGVIHNCEKRVCCPLVIYNPLNDVKGPRS